ncbi:MAG TPA: hypothetical protein VD886_16780 [Herpetosiphonaceae bacterium]|nr:hypothetical protein [Herpetosiphonaceae bacterium]
MQPYSLTLTHNELLVILRLFGVESMNGLTAAPLAGLDERQVAERLNGGEATLVSRGLLQHQDDDTAILDDALLAFVGASVFPDAILLVSETRRDGTNIPVYFNAATALMVEHVSPRPGIYVFTHIPDSALLRQRVRMIAQGILGEAPAPAEHAVSIGDQDLADVLAQVRANDQAGAMQLLEQAGWPQAAIRPFVADLATATIVTGVAATGLRDADQPDSQSIMIVRGATACWLIDQHAAGDPAMLRVRAVDGQTCLESLQALAEPLAKTLGA